MTAPRIPRLRRRLMFSDTVPTADRARPPPFDAPAWRCRAERCQYGAMGWCPTPNTCERELADDDPSGLPGPAMALVIGVGLIAAIAGASLLVGWLSERLP